LNQLHNAISDDARFSSYILLENISEFKVSYMKKADNIAIYDWQSSWAKNVALPIAVKFTIKLDNIRLSLGELIVPLKTREWAHCGYDPESKLCRTGINADCNYDVALGSCKASLITRERSA
jgi:hypothetical protein